MMIRSKISALLCLQHFLHYKYGETVWRSRASNSEAGSPISPEITLVRDFMPVLVICKFEEDQLVLSCPQHSPHFKSMGAFGCNGNHTLDPVCP